MKNCGKNWFCSDLAHFLMAQRHKILGQVRRMRHPLAVQISSPCDHFNMRFYNFFVEMCGNQGFRKKTFWNLRIKNTENQEQFCISKNMST